MAQDNREKLDIMLIVNGETHKIGEFKELEPKEDDLSVEERYPKDFENDAPKIDARESYKKQKNEELNLAGRDDAILVDFCIKEPKVFRIAYKQWNEEDNSTGDFYVSDEDYNHVAVAKTLLGALSKYAQYHDTQRYRKITLEKAESQTE